MYFEHLSLYIFSLNILLLSSNFKPYVTLFHEDVFLSFEWIYVYKSIAY